jgi:glycosyltransferase involved in cell wall biosynthesis
MSLRTLLVIPAYRESQRLPAYLATLLPALKDAGSATSVLVVDDGSGPSEVQALRKALDTLAASYSQLLPPLFLPGNRGKGAAVREGWNQSGDHQLLAFVDADGSIPAGEVLRLLYLMENSQQTNTALFSSRIKMLGHTIQRHFHRHLLGRVYASLIGLLLKVPVYDSQCGFKIIRTEIWPRTRTDLSEDGFAFDVDLLLALRKQGVRVREIPIDWCDIAGSKVCLLRDSFRMFMAILRLRRRYQL